MAQVPTVPGTVRRYGFDNKQKITYDGRITAISATKLNNIIMCDNENNKLVLCNEDGGIMSTLTLDSSPWDVTVTKKNIAYVTLPKVQSVLIVDPERLCICSRPSFNACPEYKRSYTLCVSALPNKEEVYVWCNDDRHSSMVCISDSIASTGSYSECLPNIYKTEMVVKNHIYDKIGSSIKLFHCVAGQDNVLGTSWQFEMEENKFSLKSPDLRIPSDVCSDDYGHIYVSGHNSDNIVRFTVDGDVLDIPLARHHGIIKPVAMCFNSDYTKFYVVDKFGTRVSIYDTV